MTKILEFFRDVKAELAKVSWPSRKQLTEYTLVVIGISFAVAIFLGILDFGLTELINRFVLQNK